MKKIYITLAWIFIALSLADVILCVEEDLRYPCSCTTITEYENPQTFLGFVPLNGVTIIFMIAWGIWSAIIMGQRVLEEWNKPTKKKKKKKVRT